MPHYDFFCHACNILKDPNSRRLRGRCHYLPALRQPARRTTLVRLLRHHLEEECVKRAQFFQFFAPMEVGMQFEDFSFGSVRIDDTTYEHDVVIDRGFGSAGRSPPSNSLRTLDIRPCLLKRRYPGSAADSWSVPEHDAASFLFPARSVQRPYAPASDRNEV